MDDTYICVKVKCKVNIKNVLKTHITITVPTVIVKTLNAKYNDLASC